MGNEALHLLVCTFDGQHHADEGEAAITSIQGKLREHHAGRVALVQRDSAGHLHFHEPGDPREMVSELAATFTGGLAWFIGSFAGMLGPAVAETAEHLTDIAVHRIIRDTGFPDSALYAIGEALDNGSTALIGLVPNILRDELIAELNQLGGTLHEHDLPAEIVAELRSGIPSDAR